MKVNRHILRGYDVRGLVDQDLTPELVEHFGRAYGTVMRERGEEKAVIGMDSRATSEEYKLAFARGLRSTGLDVIDIGMTLVGTVYWAQYHFGTRASAMITASHNPKEFNGFKLSADFSESLINDGLNHLADLVEREEYHAAERFGELRKVDIHDAYYNDLIGRIHVTKPFKVVIDASCATAGAIVPPLLRRAGCEVVKVNCQIDSSFPLGVADPTEHAVAARLRDEVLRHKADIGFSYDSDGDRIGIVDDQGTIIWNDVLVALFAIDVLAKHPGERIMYNTLCSKVVDETIRQYGGIPFMWRTGHGFLKKKNQEIKAPFIGELSGHFFFSADFYNHDDGCYATLRLLEYLSRTEQSLSIAIAKLPQYISSPEIKIYCADEAKRELIAQMSPALKADYPDAEVIDDERAGDGVRLELPDAMFIVRYSQNGPYLTIKFEAKTQARYDELKKYISKTLHRYPAIEWHNSIRVNVEALE